MLAIDTLETVQRYQDAGLTPEQAKAYTQILKDSQQQSVENLATKDDLDHAVELLRKDMATKAELAAVKAELKEDLAGVKAELADTKADIRMMKFMLGLLIAGVASLVLKAFFGA